MANVYKNSMFDLTTTNKTTVYTCPTDRTALIKSIQITNKFSSDLYLSGRIDFDGTSDVPLAQRVIIPYQGSVEYLTKPLVVNPSDVLRLQSLAGVGTTASGISGGLDAFVPNEFCNLLLYYTRVLYLMQLRRGCYSLYVLDDS